jgi:hypothetical protein
MAANFIARDGLMVIVVRRMTPAMMLYARVWGPVVPGIEWEVTRVFRTW